MTDVNTQEKAPDFSACSVPELIEAICHCGLDVPQGLPEAIVRKGKEIVPALCEIVGSEDWWAEDEPPRNWAVIHAMHLLGGIGDPSAIDALLAPLRWDEYNDFLCSSLTDIIARLGPDVIETAAAFVEDYTQDSSCRCVVYDGLVAIALHRPEAVEPVIRIARQMLDRAINNQEVLLAGIAYGLAHFRQKQDFSRVKLAFDNELVDTQFLFSWQNIADVFEGKKRSDAYAMKDPMNFYAQENLERLKRVNEVSLSSDSALDASVHPSVVKASSADLAGLSSDELIEAICNCGLDVPEGLPEEIVKRGSEVVPLLCRVVRSEMWWDDPDDQRCWAAIHAMHLLGGLGDASAIDALLEPLRRDQDSDFLTEDLPGIIAHLGREAFETAAAFVKDASLDEIYRSVVYSGLVGMARLCPDLVGSVIAVGRQLARRALIGGVPMPASIACSLAAFQQTDDRALLKQLYDERAVCDDFGSGWDSVQHAFEHGWQKSVAELLTKDPMAFYAPENLEHLKKVQEEWLREDEDDEDYLDDEVWVPDKDKLWDLAGPSDDEDEPPYDLPTAPIHSEHVGRNDPCPCGSGKKYKKCCGKT